MEGAEWDGDNRLRWESFDAGGWEPLLPHGGNGNWLCLDTSGGAQSQMLAGACARLSIVPARTGEADAIRTRLARFAIASATVLESIPEAGSATTFDGFILHDLRGVLDRDAVDAVLRAAVRVVAPHGFLYVALRNRFGYPRARGWRSELGPAAGARYFRPGDLAAHAAGRKVTVHPLICDAEGFLIEVIPATGYVSVKNPSLRGERLRQLLLGPRGAKLLAPAFAWIAAGPDGPPTLLESTLRRLEQTGLVRDPPARFRRYQVLRGGKVIVSAAGAAGRDGRCIVVLARAAMAIERRVREFKLLRDLAAQLPADLAGRVPRAHDHDEVAGAHRFVIEEFPGFTLEAPVPALAPATRNAADFMARLHRATARPERLTAARVRALTGPLFETAHARYPPLRSAIERLRAGVQAGLEGHVLPLVRMHGDFKIENVVVDRRGNLVGVIDWELAETDGLPLLDIGFLLVYNVYIRRGEEFVAGVRSLCPPMAVPPEERALWDDYIRALEIPPAAVPALVGALFIHHIARRMYYDSRAAHQMEPLAGLIDELTGWIADEGAKGDS